jgi:hypothetical protein
MELEEGQPFIKMFKRIAEAVTHLKLSEPTLARRQPLLLVAGVFQAVI